MTESDKDALIKELAKALAAAVDPLDLYNAYGWPDRKRVREQARAALSRVPADLRGEG